MGQDSEQAAEFVATVRNEHVGMKTWYMGDSDAAKALQAKFGPYPGLWKEVLNWPGWKEARKEYLKHTESSKEEEATDNSIPRKRKSRWGAAAAEDGIKRRSRWGDGGNNPTAVPSPSPAPLAPLPVIPGIPSNLPPELQEEMRRLQARLKEINEKMSNLDAEAARVDSLPRGHRERSPSPPPVYGTDGMRKNTRAVRWRERYTAERQDILEKLMNLNPATRKSNLLVRRRTRKIRIPIEDHPNYNFIGLIIGPRGKTQKELEAKTGCKIAIRGRGSVKEGARGRRDGKAMEGDNEPLHVVITGDDQKAVDAASEMIEQMLIVIDDEKNVHKQQQLRELALLNGTLKSEEFCDVCGEKGHRSFACPRRFATNKPSVIVKCAICGDTSHPTRDCAMKATDTKNPQEIDSDYLSFMAELDGKKVESSNADGQAPSASAINPIPAQSATLPPPPSQGISPLPPAPLGSLPVPPVAPGMNLPPPPPPVAPVPQAFSGPPSIPLQTPAPPQGNYYGHVQPHQPNGNAHYGYGAQQAPNYQQQAQQVNPGEETSGWDPSSYYGYGATGGFNWWEQQ